MHPMLNGISSSPLAKCSFNEMVSPTYKESLSTACKSSKLVIIHTRFEIFLNILDWTESASKELSDT